MKTQGFLLKYPEGKSEIGANGNLPTDSLVSTTYKDLKDKRDAGKLTPGALYRITDYNCTTTQENTRSAGHQFDIVLLALSENKLAEEGWAMMHNTPIYDVIFTDDNIKCYLNKRDEKVYDVVSVGTLLGIDISIDILEPLINEESKTIDVTTLGYGTTNLSEGHTYNYFQNSNLSAWKVWYSLDNDTDRFAWADDRVETVQAYITTTGAETMYHRNAERDRDGCFAWYGQGGFTYYTTSETPSVGDDIYYVNGSKLVLSGLSVASYTPEEILDYYGRGVIYRLIDEWGNDCPYDFKNIVIYLGRKIGEGYLFTDYETDNSDVSLTGRISDVIVKKTMNQNEYTQVIDIGIISIGSLSTIRGTIIGSGTLAGALNYGSNYLVGYRTYEI